MSVDRQDPGPSGGWLKTALGHPFWQSVLILAGSFVLLRYGLVYLPPLLGVASAPVPQSVFWQYMITVLVGVLLYVSTDEERWGRFREPLHRLLADPGQRRQRLALGVLVPVFVGILTYRGMNAAAAAPPSFRAVHPAPPNEITFQGETLRLEGLENALRHSGSMEAHLETGARVYVENCVPCHGDRLDGKGHYAHAFDPLPADFTSNGTIAQLTESYVFWRIAKGGPGLPREGTPWNSAMPAWEPFLTADEIWAVVLYLYEQTGWTPRTWEVSEAGGDS